MPVLSPLHVDWLSGIDDRIFWPLAEIEKG